MPDVFFLPHHFVYDKQGATANDFDDDAMFCCCSDDDDDDDDKQQDDDVWHGCAVRAVRAETLSNEHSVVLLHIGKGLHLFVIQSIMRQTHAEKRKEKRHFQHSNNSDFSRR